MKEGKKERKEIRHLDDEVVAEKQMQRITPASSADGDE